MSWQLLFVKSDYRIIFTISCAIGMNAALIVPAAILLIKKKGFNYTEKSIAAILVAVAIDYLFYVPIQADMDTLTKFRSGDTASAQGSVASCRLFRSRRGWWSNSAEIKVGNAVYQIDDFSNWHPCDYLLPDKPVRIKYVLSGTRRRVAVTIETGGNSAK